MIDKIGNKGEEKWYPTYAPHIILGTNKSIIDCTGRDGGYGILNNSSQGIEPSFYETYKRKRNASIDKKL